MRALLALCLAIVMSLDTFAQARLDHVEPPSWWVGMARPELQLMLHGPGLGNLTPELAPAPGVKLVGVQRVDNPNYLFLDLQIGPQAQAGEISLRFKRGEQPVLEHRYALQARRPGSAQRQGFGPRDAIYLVVPDRFANGNPGNDRMAGLLEGVQRSDPSGRHGGDLAGLRQHLDYIAGMGFTMIWPTPLSENNSERYSYHGYAATNFYQVDARFGRNEDYRALVGEARERGLGVIQDIVLNHIGANHWWMKDLPTPDWINTWPQYTETHHARMTLLDPYAAPSDRKRFSDGWFTPGMPDLNQRQPLLANYLTQMSLWWIEWADLSGVRTDTYSYSDATFLAQWSARLMQEYPRLNIVGEEWSGHPAVVSYWQAGKRNHDGYRSSLPGLMDFPLYGALLAGLNEGDSHDAGLSKLYEALAHDFLYPDPSRLVLFEGNHDTPRLFSLLNEDLDLQRMAWTYMAFARRIPQFTYGAELLLTSPRERDDGAVRADFPGGWAGDAVNGFSGAGLSPRQREAQAFLRRLLHWRKGEPLVHEGALTHYAPLDGQYVLFRHDGRGGARKLMLVLNKRRESVQLDLSRFGEMLGPQARLHDLLQDRAMPAGPRLSLPPRSATLLEVR
jgi:glycosidase